MAFSTHILDEALKRHREKGEACRKKKFAEAYALLAQLAEVFPFKEAYLFGSLARPGHFSARSDLDIAIQGLSAEDWIPAMSFLSSGLGREVDLIRLENFPWKGRIIKEGIRWKKES